MHKKMTVAGVCVVVAIALTGCGSASGSGSSDPGNGMKVKSSGQLTIAYRSDDKPYSFLDHDKPSGFDVQLIRKMSKEIGLTPKFVAMEFESMLPNVRNHQSDVAGFDTLVTSERKKQVDFTTPINFRQASLLSLKKNPLPKTDNANGQLIAITRGSALIPVLKKIAPSVKLKEFPNVAASTNALLAGSVDGLFTGSAKASELANEHKEFKLSSDQVTSGKAAFPVAKDRPKLRKALDKAVGKLVKNGTYAKLFNKWFDTKIPDEMRDAYPSMKG